MSLCIRTCSPLDIFPFSVNNISGFMLNEFQYSEISQYNSVPVLQLPLLHIFMKAIFTVKNFILRVWAFCLHV